MGPWRPSGSHRGWSRVWPAGPSGSYRRVSAETCFPLLTAWRGIVQPHPVASDRVDVLVPRIHRCQPVAQPADERVQRLVGNTRGLFLSPDGRNKIGTSNYLSLALVEQ